MRTFLFIIAVLLCPVFSAQAGDDRPEIQAWSEMTKRLELIGIEALKTYPQPNAIDRAEGLRYLLQQLSSSIQAELVRQPGQIPLLRIGATTINKWGLDGADAKYQGATIDGGGSYLFYGQLGSARLFAMQLTRMSGGYAAYGALTGDQLNADEAGNFEILISPSKPKDWQGVWLELNSDTDNILVREYFADWNNEFPGRYYLKQIGNSAPVAPVTAAQVNTLLDDTADTFSSRITEWQGRVEQSRTHLVNKVHMRKADGQGLGSNVYGSGWFKVGQDEALIIEMAAPEALLWSVQLGNVWWESLDYINRTASYNDSQAAASSDGRYRFVLSHSDPGVPNWLDPAGHFEGALLFRLQKTEAVVDPVLKLVPFTDVAKYLPEDTPTIEPQQRQSEIAMRRSHAAIRWAP